MMEAFIIFFAGVLGGLLCTLAGGNRLFNKPQPGATLRDEGYFVNGLYQYRCSGCANAILTTERITDHFRFPVPSRRITTPPEPWSIRYCWHCGVPFKHIELNPKYFSQHP